MKKLISGLFFKLISLVLINSFLFFDFTCVGAAELIKVRTSDCLSPAIQINAELFLEYFSNQSKNAWIQSVGIPEIRDKQRRLLAPNGKPSNLTEKLWKLVRTDTFKEWFGDWEKYPDKASKIVDENGEPLVMRHTSPSDFTIFKKAKIASRDHRIHGGRPILQGALGSGMYFTTRQDVLDN